MIKKVTMVMALIAMGGVELCLAQDASHDYGYKQAPQPKPVRRYCQTLQLKNDPDLIAEYEKWHQSENIWKEITDGLMEVGVIDSEIYRHGTLLVMILTVPADFDFQVQMGKLAQLSRQAEWEEFMSKYQASDPNAASSEKWVQMKRIFKLAGE
ncbi:L-rhamnose mutarotase [Pseudozobellia sp. WGM2]|uniref:L-rhamnose mutarotase n=1 Tax=Pseudozobellia sp. WGM2 TaxID=2787625 RepID=UPI001ADF4CDD|nr:L-rhamnose mutarotase [Pseudozobellia sp. WGM2]